MEDIFLRIHVKSKTCSPNSRLLPQSTFSLPLPKLQFPHLTSTQGMVRRRKWLHRKVMGLHYLLTPAAPLRPSLTSLSYLFVLKLSSFLFILDSWWGVVELDSDLTFAGLVLTQWKPMQAGYPPQIYSSLRRLGNQTKVLSFKVRCIGSGPQQSTRKFLGSIPSTVKKEEEKKR